MESWALFCDKTAQIIAKTSTSLPVSVSDMLTYVNFPTFAVVDLWCGRLISVLFLFVCGLWEIDWLFFCDAPSLSQKGTRYN